MKATVTDMQQFAFSVEIDCENSRHFAIPLVVSPRNDVKRNERILMTRHYPDLGTYSASDWPCT